MGTSLKPRDAVADEHVKPETVHAFAQERTQELFEEHVAELPNLLPLERHVLAQYCRCLAVAEHCETILAEEGLITISPRTGFPIQHPAVNIRNQNLLLAVKLESSLGITRASKKKMKESPKKKRESKLEKLVANTPQLRRMK